MSYYHGLISSRKASSVLSLHGNGSFLIRDSQSQPGNFVLSARSCGRMYHVLIFHKGGQYYLDLAGEGEEANFESLDDLVMFIVGHELRVEGDEVKLQEPVSCASPEPLPSNGSSASAGRTNGDNRDSDHLTDLFANLFGAHCAVVAMAHSNLNFDGQPLEDDKELLAVVIKDSKLKSYFIRIIDTKDKKVLGEKKIGKTFQFDMPGDLVMTFLSEHGITCIGFRDVREKERFQHQVARVVRLQQDRAMKLRGRGNSETAKSVQKPTELTHRIKAADFDINKVTPEWQYLFDMAGITQAMLEEKGTLQFILDTVYKIGGAPQKLQAVQEEALSEAGAGLSGQQQTERVQVLAVDHALRRETLRASKLSAELKNASLKIDTPMLKSPGCSFKAQCEGFKDSLMLKHSLYALGPESALCFCEQCAAGKPLVQVAGSPPQQYTLPIGWCRFVHRSQSHVLSQQFCSRWHVAYCSVACSRVAGVMRTGQLPQSHSSGKVSLSPDIQTACRITGIKPHSYIDEIRGRHFRVNTAFQVYIQPQSYSVHAVKGEASDQGPSPLQSQLEWQAFERTYIVHGLLVQLLPD